MNDHALARSVQREDKYYLIITDKALFHGQVVTKARKVSAGVCCYTDGVKLNLMCAYGHVAMAKPKCYIDLSLPCYFILNSSNSTKHLIAGPSRKQIVLFPSNFDVSLNFVW